MFTGIVEALGTVTAIDRRDRAIRLTIEDDLLTDLAAGESVAVNGVCLTATEASPRTLHADVMQETLDHSSLRALAVDDRVNLERSVTPTTRLGGHLVQGHVDGVGRVVRREESERWTLVEVALPADLSSYVVLKGSIALDGVSLTVSAIDGDRVAVSLIPETLRRTTLGGRDVGAAVNVEVDVLAKYVEKLLTVRVQS